MQYYALREKVNRVGALNGYYLNSAIISMKKTGVFRKCFWTVGLLASINEFILRVFWGMKMPLYLRIFF